MPCQGAPFYGCARGITTVRDDRLNSSRSCPPGNTGRLAVELHYVASPQLPPAPGLWLAVHEDLAGRDQFLGVRAGLHEAGQLQELPKPD